MLIITIPGDRIKFIKGWASANYQKFYERMSHNPKIRERSVYVGKIGEEAVAQHLGIKADYSEGVDKGYDLIYEGEHIAVKTKEFKVFPILDGEWCHIPIDQYQKISRNSTILVGCIVLSGEPKVWIIGYLKMDEVDHLKEYHKEGQRLTPWFQLPHPDSWGIKYSYFHSIKELGEPLLDF